MMSTAGDLRPEKPFSTPERRRSICYVAPGQYLLETAGPTRNVLNLASALADFADVSVAFRRVPDKSLVPDEVNVLQIEAQNNSQSRPIVDDAAVRGIGIGEFIRYTKAVRRFVRQELAHFDLVFEKSWTLSGLVAAECRKIGVPAIVVENLVPVVGGESSRDLGFAKRLKVRVGSLLAGHYLRNARRIIAETEVLKSAMIEHWQIPRDRISVVSLGIDRDIFKPIDQQIAREELGIPGSATILLYSGVIDHTHNLRPVISAMNRLGLEGVELHVIGDGILRDELQRVAGKSKATVKFHGRIPYRNVPKFIAAADLCLAPYEPGAFPGGKIAYSSLKIPEYMSVGRPVVSVPSGRVLDLVKEGSTGFLFANTEEEWTRFLGDIPDRVTLARMGRAAATSKLDSWHDVSRAYLEVGQSEMESAGHV